MKYLLTKEIAAAEKRGERDFSETLREINADNAHQEKINSYKLYAAKNVSLNDTDF